MGKLREKLAGKLGLAKADEEARRAAAAQEDEEEEEEEDEAEAENQEDQDDEAAEDEEDEEDENEAESSAAGGDRKRIAAILRAPEAKGREALAQFLALETDLPVKAAIGALKASPAAAKGKLAAAMATTAQPDLGTGAPANDGDQVQRLAASIIQAGRKARGQAA